MENALPMTDRKFIQHFFDFSRVVAHDPAPTQTAENDCLFVRFIMGDVQNWPGHAHVLEELPRDLRQPFIRDIDQDVCGSLFVQSFIVRQFA